MKRSGLSTPSKIRLSASALFALTACALLVAAMAGCGGTTTTPSTTGTTLVSVEDTTGAAKVSVEDTTGAAKVSVEDTTGAAKINVTDSTASPKVTVEFRVGSDAKWSGEIVAPATSIVSGDLEPGTYDVIVTAKDAGGTAVSSSSGSVTIEQGKQASVALSIALPV
jgi:hypothetical protein